MEVIIIFTFCWKNIVYGSGESLENLQNVFLLLCGHHADSDGDDNNVITARML